MAKLYFQRNIYDYVIKEDAGFEAYLIGEKKLGKIYVREKFRRGKV